MEMKLKQNFIESEMRKNNDTRKKKGVNTRHIITRLFKGNVDIPNLKRVIQITKIFDAKPGGLSFKIANSCLY